MITVYEGLERDSMGRVVWGMGRGMPDGAFEDSAGAGGDVSATSLYGVHWQLQPAGRMPALRYGARTFGTRFAVPRIRGPQGEEDHEQSKRLDEMVEGVMVHRTDVPVGLLHHCGGE